MVDQGDRENSTEIPKQLSFRLWFVGLHSFNLAMQYMQNSAENKRGGENPETDAMIVMVEKQMGW